MNTIHETVFCNSPKNAALESGGNFAGYAFQDKDLNEQYREYKKVRPCGNKERTN